MRWTWSLSGLMGVMLICVGMMGPRRVHLSADSVEASTTYGGACGFCALNDFCDEISCIGQDPCDANHSEVNRTVAAFNTYSCTNDPPNDCQTSNFMQCGYVYYCHPVTVGCRKDESSARTRGGDVACSGTM
jgi:hypothetical protein